jgi:hypothetical protein
MDCTSFPEPNDWELLAYIDGEADDRVAAHLAKCPHCRERARRLTRLQNRLTARIYRVACPSPATLGEYHLGILPPERAAAVAQHLEECGSCAREVAQLEDYLIELIPTLELTPLERAGEKVKVLVARLVGGEPGDGMPGQPAYAGIRGEDEASYLYEAEDIQIVIGIQDDATQPDRKATFGLVVGVEPGDVKAYLWQAERCIAIIPVDELGNFIIPDLKPGSYELIVTGPQIEVHVQELRVGTN